MKDKKQPGAPKGNKNRSLPEEERKTENILLRVTKSEKEVFKAKAAEKNLTLSQWILSRLR